MAYTKKVFVDNQTVIDATFLNGIQDQVITNETEIGTLNDNIATINNGKSPNMNYALAKYSISESSVDLNTLTAYGIYQMNGATNAPSGVTGWMTVSVIPMGNDNPSYCRQVLYQLLTNNIFVRYRQNGTWNDWTELAKKSDLATKIEGLSLWMESGKTLSITRTSVIHLLFSATDSSSCLVRISAAGVTALIGTIPSTVSISSSGNRATIQNNVAWAVEFTILGRLSYYSVS